MNNKAFETMAKSFNLEVQKKPTSKGKYPVYIRITEDRKHRRLKTSIELDRYADWNPKKQEIRSSEPNCEKWNETLSVELEGAKSSNRDKKGLSLDALTKVIKEKDTAESFLTYAKAKIEEARASESIGTYRHYKTTIQKLEGYLEDKGKDDLKFNEVDLTFLNSFNAYLSKVENGRTAGRTLDTITIANYLKKLRKIVNEAVDEERISIEKNPFLKFSIDQGGESKKEKLEKDEIERIEALELEKGSALWHTRNAFLFSFYCAGIRCGDLLQLRWENVEGGRLYYQMGKTDKVKNQALVEDAEAILDCYRSEDALVSDYIFPFLNSKEKYAIESYKGYHTMPEELKKVLFNQVSSRNVILNRNLKKIALMAKIRKNLSTHISRHSFANLAMKENVSTPVIKKLLAHSSIKTTEGYMGNFSNAEVDEALEKMFSKKGQGKNEANKALLEALNNADKETLVSALAEVLNKLNQ